MTLKRFLIKKRAFRKFNRNLKNLRAVPCGYNEYLDTLRDTGECLSGGFPFFASPEGKDFWRELETEWQRHISKRIHK